MDKIEAVNLGLPSGVLWAMCNVGAETPSDPGAYLAWGESSPKEDYTWGEYKWCESSHDTLTAYNVKQKYGATDGVTTLVQRDDAACAIPGGWRMPTVKDWSELCSKCTWEWTELNGKDGYRVIGPSGGSIFLPVTGARIEKELLASELFGWYWTNSISPEEPCKAQCIGFCSDVLGMNTRVFRHIGLCVRPVKNGPAVPRFTEGLPDDAETIAGDLKMMSEIYER